MKKNIDVVIQFFDDYFLFIGTILSSIIFVVSGIRAVWEQYSYLLLAALLAVYGSTSWAYFLALQKKSCFHEKTYAKKIKILYSIGLVDIILIWAGITLQDSPVLYEKHEAVLYALLAELILLLFLFVFFGIKTIKKILRWVGIWEDEFEEDSEEDSALDEPDETEEELKEMTEEDTNDENADDGLE